MCQDHVVLLLADTLKMGLSLPKPKVPELKEDSRGRFSDEVKYLVKNVSSCYLLYQIWFSANRMIVSPGLYYVVLGFEVRRSPAPFRIPCNTLNAIRIFHVCSSQFEQHLLGNAVCAIIMASRVMHHTP